MKYKAHLITLHNKSR